MTDVEDKRLGGREPEFARMSLRPGIGADAALRVAECLRLYEIAGDCPSALRIGSKILPVGRYLRERIRLAAGISDEVKQATLDEWRKELSELRKAAAALSSREVYVEGTYNEDIFRALLVEQDAEKVRQLEARRKLYERGKK